MNLLGNKMSEYCHGTRRTQQQMHLFTNVKMSDDPDANAMHSYGRMKELKTNLRSCIRKRNPSYSYNSLLRFLI